MAVEIVEVGPRDGLQNEAVTVPTARKIEFVRLLAAAGARRIEVTSFVRPDRVPQLADAEEVLAGIDLPDVAISTLVMNERGLKRARVAEVGEINLVVVATDTFSMRNQGTTTADAIAGARRLAGQAKEAGMRVTLTVGASFGCPFEGEVAPGRVLALIETAAGEVDEVCLADTIGVATPGRVSALVAATRDVTPLPIRCHFHNTRNSGYANAYAAIAAGAVALDASSGGIGGCPFAPRATGNIATEDLTWALHRDGYDTGLDIDGLLRATALVERTLGKPVPALLGRTDPFPSPEATTQL